MLEVGYRCPLCHQTEPLEFEHIEEYSVVQKHEFTNMIVLCASCHGRKKDTSSPRHINRASLRKLKQSLMLLNGRYSDLSGACLKCSKSSSSRTRRCQLRQSMSYLTPYFYW